VASPASGHFHDPGRVNGTQYFYEVAAVNATGTGAWSNQGRNGTPTAVEPAAPTGVAVYAGNGGTTLTWDSVPGATSYGWCYSDTQGGPYNCFCCGNNGLIAHPGGLTNGNPQYYVVRAVAPGGTQSAYSAEVSATPSSLLPAQPTGVAVTGGNAKLAISWDPVSGATGYKVYRRSVDSAWSLVGNPASSPLTDTGLIDATQYFYEVAAANATGTGAWSNQGRNGTPTAAAPMTPTGVTAYPGNGRNTIIWDPVPGANSYAWCHSGTSGGPYNCFCCGNTDLAEHPGSLTNDIPQYYVIQAIEPGGARSVYSAEVSATPASTLPDQPGTPSVAAASSRLTVNWSAVNGATGYRLYRRTDGTKWVFVLRPLGRKRLR
jgi:hypothetical protein